MSINTADLDCAVVTKAAADIAAPASVQQLRLNPRISEQASVEFLPRAPLTCPHFIDGEDKHQHDADKPKP